jgi:hypothetical protein
MLSQRGRRVLENASEKKRGLDPLRSQSRNRRKLIDEIWNTDDRSGRRMIVAAGGNDGDCARVIGTIRIPMNALVQLGRSAQCQRPKKSQAKESRDNGGAVAPGASH